MTDTLWCVIMSGYTKQNDGLGYDDPEFVCACDRKDIADAMLNQLLRIGKCLDEINGIWIPDCPSEEGQHFIAPALSFIIPVDNSLQNNWYAIVTEGKTFSLTHDENIFSINGIPYTSTPSDFTPCKKLRFHTVTEKTLDTILKIHRVGTTDSDGKVVYFIPDENTFIQN